MPTRARATTRPRRRQLPTRTNCTEFKPQRGTGREYKIRRIPAAFWDEVTEKAKRTGTSLRGLILTHLRDWVREPRTRKRAA